MIDQKEIIQFLKLHQAFNNSPDTELIKENQSIHSSEQSKLMLLFLSKNTTLIPDFLEYHVQYFNHQYEQIIQNPSTGEQLSHIKQIVKQTEIKNNQLTSTFNRLKQEQILSFIDQVYHNDYDSYMQYNSYSKKEIIKSCLSALKKDDNQPFTILEAWGIKLLYDKFIINSRQHLTFLLNQKMLFNIPTQNILDIFALPDKSKPRLHEMTQLFVKRFNYQLIAPAFSCFVTDDLVFYGLYYVQHILEIMYLIHCYADDITFSEKELLRSTINTTYDINQKSVQK